MRMAGLDWNRRRRGFRNDRCANHSAATSHFIVDLFVRKCHRVIPNKNVVVFDDDADGSKVKEFQDDISYIDDLNEKQLQTIKDKKIVVAHVQRLLKFKEWES